MSINTLERQPKIILLRNLGEKKATSYSHDSEALFSTIVTFMRVNLSNVGSSKNCET